MYTKSIGSKLLAKMGYKGGGLGKDGTGMAKPIEVKVRPKNLGLGAGGFDRRSEEELEEERKRACTSTAKTATAKVVKIPDAPPQVQEKVRGGRRECVDELTCPQGWKKDRKQKPKVVYKTAEEIVREATPQKQVIIDMTTAQPRVLTSLDQVHSALLRGSRKLPGASARQLVLRADGRQAIAPEAALKKAVYMPELQYNIRTLVDLLEINLQNLDRKHKNEKEAIERLTREARRLEALAKAESEQRERLRAMNEILSRVRQRIAASQMTPEALAKNFELLQKDYKEEYYVFNLPALALALALPLMRTHLDAWDPASNPSGPVPLLQTWQNVLRPEGDGPKDVQAEIQEPYFRLCYELLLPRLRSFISSRWDPRNADPVIRLFEAFDGVLPPRIQRNLLEYSVLPKLRAAVEAWNPRTDPVPVHSWLHPFLPLLGDQLEPLYIPIRHKLARALQEWHPSDASAYGVLAPWKEVWDSGSMERLLVACIVPKLIGALRQLVINPLQQDPRPFQWVTAWADLLPAHHLAQMFESEFFPKWLVTLHAWLMGRPNFEEVMRWYLGWKSLLPAGLESHPRVEYYLNHALNLMNRAVSGQPLGPILPVPGQSELPPLPEEQPPPPPPPPPPPRPPPPPSEPRPPPPPPVDISLREVVEKIAEEHGLLFMPNPRRHHPGGKQVHSFGKVDVVLDRDVLYALKAGQWVPVSVEELLDMARKM